MIYAVIGLAVLLFFAVVYIVEQRRIHADAVATHAAVDEGKNRTVSFLRKESDGFKSELATLKAKIKADAEKVAADVKADVGKVEGGAKNVASKLRKKV